MSIEEGGKGATYTKVLGWTFAQWAEVVPYVRRFQAVDAPGLQSAMEIQRQWRTVRIDDPGGGRIIEVAHEMDFGWAAGLFADVPTIYGFLQYTGKP